MGTDNVNHPAHYTQGKIEVADFIADQKLDFFLGNAVKYVCRCRFKDNYVEDLQKAVWYINKAIDEEKKKIAEKKANHHDDLAT